jgi:hypothetical protein
MSLSSILRGIMEVETILVKQNESGEENPINMWLIGLIIVLIAVLGLAVGFIIEPIMKPAPVIIMNNSTTPQTNNTQLNKTVKNTTKTPGITPTQAMSIAKKYEKSYGAEPDGTVHYLNGKGMYYGADGDPFYHVDLKWIDPKRSVAEYGVAGYIEIDAITGEINPRR